MTVNPIATGPLSTVRNLVKFVTDSPLSYGKTGNVKRATCFAIFLQNELNSDVVRFTTDLRACLATNKVAGFVFVGGKTRSTAIQFVLQQFCKTSCTFFVARYTRGPLAINKLPSDALRAHGSHYSGVFDRESWKPNCSDRQLAADLLILHRCLRYMFDDSGLWNYCSPALFSLLSPA